MAGQREGGRAVEWQRPLGMGEGETVGAGGVPEVQECAFFVLCPGTLRRKEGSSNPGKPHVLVLRECARGLPGAKAKKQARQH